MNRLGGWWLRLNARKIFKCAVEIRTKNRPPENRFTVANSMKFATFQCENMFRFSNTHTYFRYSLQCARNVSILLYVSRIILPDYQVALLQLL